MPEARNYVERSWRHTFLPGTQKKSHRWGDNLEDDFQRNGDMYFGSWSSGKSKNILPGDRVFLIRLGKDPRGIVASGWAGSKVYAGRHWDEALAASGKSGLFVDVRLETLLDSGKEDIFPRKTLDKGILGKMHWDSQASGIRIPNEVAAKLCHMLIHMNPKLALSVEELRRMLGRPVDI